MSHQCDEDDGFLVDLIVSIFRVLLEYRWVTAFVFLALAVGVLAYFH